MSAMQIVLEIGLVMLLAITLAQAIRLERALGVLKRGRNALEPMVEEFDTSTRHAEAAIARLHDAAEGAGRQIGRQADTAIALKDDLAFLVERGDRLADRIDGLVRAARPLATERPRLVAERTQIDDVDSGRTPAERRLPKHVAPKRSEPVRVEQKRAELIGAEQMRDSLADGASSEDRTDWEGERGGRTRIRSQAERDLLKALRVAR